MDPSQQQNEEKTVSPLPHRRAVVAGGAAALAVALVGTPSLATAKQGTPDPAATPGGQQRFVAVRGYRFAAGRTYADLTGPIEGGYFPILQAAPGFVAHYIIDSGEGTVVAVSIWESKEAADESTRLAADFIAASLVGFFETAPELTEGPAPLYREGAA